MNTESHPELPLEAVPQQVQGYREQKTVDGHLLKHESSGRVVKLNDTGMLIWRACTGEWNIGEIIDALKEGYPDAAANIDKDVYSALSILQKEQVITLS